MRRLRRSPTAQARRSALRPEPRHGDAVQRSCASAGRQGRPHRRGRRQRRAQRASEARGANSSTFQEVLSDARPYRRTSRWRPEPGSSNRARMSSVATLAEALGLDELTACVLVRRGYDDPAEARRFLEGALPGHDPFALGDMPEAVDCDHGGHRRRARASACTATTTPTASARPRSPSSSCAS